MHKQPAPQLASPWARLRAALGRVVGLGDASARDRRLADEIAFHIDMATERNRRAGMSAADARRAALLEFGGIERSKEAARDEHRSRPIEDALRDLHYAMRSLRRAPAFALTTVLTLAIGIGANTAIFSAVDGVLLKPLPYADADRLMTLWQRDAAKATQDLLSPANFLDWRDRTRAFETIATAEPFSMTLTTSDGPEMIRNWNVSEAFFQTLAVRPFLGRFFTAADHLPNHAPVIVISYESCNAGSERAATYSASGFSSTDERRQSLVSSRAVLRILPAASSGHPKCSPPRIARCGRRHSCQRSEDSEPV